MQTFIFYVLLVFDGLGGLRTVFDKVFARFIVFLWLRKTESTARVIVHGVAMDGRFFFGSGLDIHIEIPSG